MAEDDPTPPVACTLDEDRAEERAEHVLSTLVPKFEGATETADGYEIRFTGTGETLPALAQFVAEESECCVFADFRLVVSPPYDATNLLVTGPEGTKELFGTGFVDRLEAEQEEVQIS